MLANMTIWTMKARTAMMTGLNIWQMSHPQLIKYMNQQGMVWIHNKVIPTKWKMKSIEWAEMRLRKFWRTRSPSSRCPRNKSKSHHSYRRPPKKTARASQAWCHSESWISGGWSLRNEPMKTKVAEAKMDQMKSKRSRWCRSGSWRSYIKRIKRRGSRARRKLSEIYGQPGSRGWIKRRKRPSKPKKMPHKKQTTRLSKRPPRHKMKRAVQRKFRSNLIISNSAVKHQIKKLKRKRALIKMIKILIKSKRNQSKSKKHQLKLIRMRSKWVRRIRISKCKKMLPQTIRCHRQLIQTPPSHLQMVWWIHIKSEWRYISFEHRIY